MKRILLLCLSSLFIVACSNQQTDTSSTMEEKPAVTAQVEAPVVAEPKEVVEPEMSEHDKLWERYCNHEALTTMERQEIADSQMPEKFKGSCIQK